MDWENLEADVTKLLPPGGHWTPGRGGNVIKYIVRHHNAGILTTEDCWRLWQDREASAHYQVENSGRIGQLVNDWDTAWHAANQLRNQQSIAIEHANAGGPNQDWPINDRVLDQGAHLAAALCKAYGLGRPEFGKNIRDHKETGQTSCPYHLANGGKYHKKWMDRAVYWYDQMTRATPAPHLGKEQDMNAEERAALNDTKLLARECRDLLKEIRFQLTGSDRPGQFPGLPQSGGRTLYDLTSAIAEIEGVVGTRDIKEG